MYAILSHGGRQYRVSAGDRLVVDRLDAQVGSVVALEPVLLTGGDGETRLGKDLDGLRVAVTVVAHRRGEKLRIFKYKAKKRSRKMAGYRSDLTELRVESILAKDAALPAAPAAQARPRGVAAAKTPAAGERARRTPAKPAAPAAKSAATTKATAAEKPKAATAGRATAAGEAEPESTAAPEQQSPPAAAAKPAARTKAAPKRATKPVATSEDEDGA